MSSHIGFVLAIYILLSLAIVGAWDVYAILILQDATATVSSYLQYWGQQFPIGVLAVGIIIGHLLWPRSQR